MDQMPLQTLQIYRKVEKIPSEVQVRRITEELDLLKKSHPSIALLSHNRKPDPIPEEKRVKSIDFQNTLTDIEKELLFWVNDYRSLIDEIREFDRILPKSQHEVEESDRKAKENVEKIIRVEDIKTRVVEQFKSFFLNYEDTTEKSRKYIRQLETELAKTQNLAENLEYELRKATKHHKK